MQYVKRVNRLNYVRQKYIINKISLKTSDHISIHIKIHKRYDYAQNGNYFSFTNIKTVKFMK